MSRVEKSRFTVKFLLLVGLAGAVLTGGCAQINPPLKAAEIQQVIGHDGIKAGHLIRDELIEITPDGKIIRAIGGSRGVWREAAAYRWQLQGDKFCVDKGEGPVCYDFIMGKRDGFDEMRWLRADRSTESVWLLIH